MDAPADRQRLARQAGAWYLALALVAPLGLVIVPARLAGADDPAALAQLVREQAWWLRAGLASELLHQLIEVPLVLTLYALFAPQQRGAARLMAVLGLLPIPIVFVSMLGELAALQLQGDAAWLAGWSAEQRHLLTQLALKLHHQGLALAMPFWGLWLLPLGALAARSGLMPRAVGPALWVAGTAYVADAALRLLWPAAQPALAGPLAAAQAAELAVIAGLLMARPR
jgi:Domain of unknown function (DUF4386)